MKKIYTIAAALLVCASTQAQINKQVAPTPEMSGNYFDFIKPGEPKFTNNEHYKTNATDYYWLSYATAQQTVNGNKGVKNTSYLFSDSLAQFKYGTTMGQVSYYSISNTFDIRKFGTGWNPNDQLILDSMGVHYAYVRNDANAVDTLVINLFTDPNSYVVYSHTQMQDRKSTRLNSSH